MRKTTSWMAGITVIAVTLATIVFLSPPVKADASAAEATYKAKCAMCHGPDGRGETAMGKMMKVRDFSEVRKMSDADLTSVISSRKGKMPPYKTLSADQVKDLVAYIRAFGRKN